MEPHVFCLHPFRRLKIDPEGNCSFCCYQQRKCLGNILSASLQDIWHGFVAEEVRNLTVGAKLHPTCKIKACPYYHVQHELYKIKKPFSMQEVPVEIELDLPIQHCNIGGEKPTVENPACLMCERNLPTFKPHIDKVKEICEVLKPYADRFVAVHIQGIAEPFWKDRIFEIMEDLEIRRHTNISTTTNGTALNEKRMYRWLYHPITVTTFSIDAATPETFKKIRRLDAYDEVIATLLEYSRLRSPTQSLQIHNNINTINIDEVEGMVEVAAKAKVNCIEFNPTFGRLGIEVSETNFREFLKAEKKIKEAAAKLNVQARFVRRLALDYAEQELVQIKI